MHGKPTEIQMSEQALQDIEAISAWYESQDAWQAAADVPLKILNAIEDLALHPEAGAIGVSGNRERVISSVPYRVAYVFDAVFCRVTIYSVAHTRRQWPLYSC